jgi:hypothetical protein
VLASQEGLCSMELVNWLLLKGSKVILIAVSNNRFLNGLFVVE